ncbi:MAG: dephospho-CoA kinase [Alphaproteobacteria bacterium]|nr:MAG: dephospho-CoA kinase [Alphaproteobacteria bacterium]
MIVIGITGSIGMGKTTAANMLKEMGIPVHDSDASVHALLGPDGGAVTAVAAKFPEVLQKDAAGRSYIDRQVLGRIVFGDRQKKRELEEILHPLVRAESDAFKEEMRKKAHKIIALDIPLLFETGGEKRVDVTICISAPKDVQRERVLARPGMTSEKFDRIVSGQLPDAEKRKRATYIVESDKGFDDMRKQIEKIVDRIRSRRKYN